MFTIPQDRLKADPAGADDGVVTSEITRSMHHVLCHLVEEVPGVEGALVASVDGFTLASHLPSGRSIDRAGLSAMSAAAIALSNQLSATNGPSGATVSHHISEHGQVMLIPIAQVAVLTLLASPGAGAGVLARAGHRCAGDLVRLFRGTAAV